MRLPAAKKPPAKAPEPNKQTNRYEEAWLYCYNKLDPAHQKRVSDAKTNPDTKDVVVRSFVYDVVLLAESDEVIKNLKKT